MSSLIPDDTPEYMTPAWIGCMNWAIQEPEIRAAFESDTGMRYTPPNNALDEMIDNATGYGEDYVKSFVQWANINVWGSI